jgi:hypothetical protein
MHCRRLSDLAVATLRDGGTGLARHVRARLAALSGAIEKPREANYQAWPR